MRYKMKIFKYIFANLGFERYYFGSSGLKVINNLFIVEL